MDLGSRILEQRQGKGMTQEELAERISYGLLTDVLKGYVARDGSMVYLVRLIRYLISKSKL